MQTLFSYKFQADPLSTDREESGCDLFLRGLIEFKMNNSPLLFQAGADPEGYAQGAEGKGAAGGVLSPRNSSACPRLW